MRRFVRTPGAARTALFVGVGLTLVMTTTAEAAPLARYFPRQDLAVYAEFDGLDNHADLWRKSAAYRLLTETTTGAMLEDVATRLAGRAMTSAPGQSLSVAELRAVVEHAARSGFAVGVVRKADDRTPACVGVVLRGAARGKVREAVEKVTEAGRAQGTKLRSVDKPGGRTVMIEGGERPRQGFAWWREGDDLAFSMASPEGADLMIDALDGRTPDATGHPGRADLGRAEVGFTPVGLAFMTDQGALKDLSGPRFAAFGLDQVTRIDYRWGFHGEALMTVTRVVAPAPRSGLLSLFDQPTFDRRGLPPLPPGLNGFTTFSADLPGLYDRFAAGFANSDPTTRVGFEAFEKAFRARTGLRLRDDLLTHLGPKVTAYALPSRVDAPSHFLAGLAQGLMLTPAWAVVIDVRGVDRFSTTLDDAMTKAGESYLADAEAGSRPPYARIRKLDGYSRGYVVSISPTVVPLPAGSRPTVILGKTSLVIGSTPDAARGAIALEGKKGGVVAADDALAGSVGRLPGGMIFAHVSDDRRSLLPALIANLPALIRWYGSTNLGFGPRFGPNGQRVPFWSQPALLEIDPDKVPDPDDLRPFLFSSEFTLVSDDQGFRFTTREAFPAFNPVALAPVAAALILPSFQARQAAMVRMQSVNNLKQIGLALHNYHSTFDHFPPATISDKNGKPLLSWRVAILPYLEQQDLYNEFKLDEPWDSPNNKPLIARMPDVFTIPNAVAEPGTTFYRGFAGDGAFFDPKVKAGVGLRDVTDGTSNTIGVAEARKAVPWTKPGEEIAFDAAAQPPRLDDLLQSLGGHSPGGFNALLLDGSVRFIKQSVHLQVLKALITRNGGEVIDVNAF